MIIDLRSDTVTKPTDRMRQAMAEAEVGDDVYGEDPTIAKLEQKSAELLGKEAALFCPSGTMANQIAVMTHVSAGQEVIVEAEAHVYFYEVGGISRLAGAQPRTIAGSQGVFTPEQLLSVLRPLDVHFPVTGLVCVENTHNRSGGTVWTAEQVDAIGEAAHDRNLPVHMDGARLFNAAVAQDVPAARLVRSVDSVMFCLSKGLGAPIGSMLVGSKAFIARAHKNRKLLGGGLRQVGVLGAAGLVALDEMIDRLADDHKNAQLLADGIGAVAGLRTNRPVTNMVMVDIEKPGLDAPTLVARLKQAGVLANATGPSRIRLVTHKDVDTAACKEAVATFARVI